MMRRICVLVCFSALVGTTATAGGLADAITEREPVVIQDQAAERGTGWVLPLVALALVPVVATDSGSGGSDDSGGGSPIILDPK